jgi:BirA family biotin operon repressor/biotin-[acetyl-CoA-carboxylase] ligase
MERPLVDLRPPGRWLGRRTHLYRRVDSTNRIADELAERGAPEGTIVLADRQTAGRGRLGRSFFSPPGGLYLSVVLRPDIPAEDAPRYVFVAAVAVADAAAPHLDPRVRVEIKWPNDVLLAGRKTSGINLPARIEGNRVRSLVLGIGVNVNVAQDEIPSELLEVATSLRIARGRRLCRVEFAEGLLSRLEEEIDRLRRSGFEQTLDRWRKYFRMRGARVRVGGPGIAREVEGVVEGVDSAGALRLRTERGSERVVAGDVTILERAG